MFGMDELMVSSIANLDLIHAVSTFAGMKLYIHLEMGTTSLLQRRILHCAGELLYN